MVDVLDFGKGWSRDQIIEMAESKYLSSSAISQFTNYEKKGRTNPATLYLEKNFSLDLENAICYRGYSHASWFFISQIACIKRENIGKKSCGCNCEEKSGSCGIGGKTQLYSSNNCGCCQTNISKCCDSRTIGNSFQISQPIVIKWDDEMIRLLPNFFVQYLIAYIANEHVFRFSVEFTAGNRIERKMLMALSNAKMQDNLLYRKWCA